tara:strand:+ start:81 stop:407 length:327 start_codon:yes stop_codon:yes gene_type:complete
MSKDYYKENDERMNVIGQNGNDGLHYAEVDKMSDIKTVWEGRYVKVNLVDTTTECTITNNVYSLTEMIDLHEELVDAFDVTIKELKKLNHDVTYSEQMQEKLEPIDNE